MNVKAAKIFIINDVIWTLIKQFVSIAYDVFTSVVVPFALFLKHCTF